MDTQERLHREKEFHNETFSSNSRKSAKKYYKSASASKSHYHDLLQDEVKGKKVLEYGCGPGSAAFKLARLGANVSGIDISDVAISQSDEIAKEMGLTIDFNVMDCENLKFYDSSFDLICGSGILHHLDLERSYKEIQRTLKADGKAVFFEPLGIPFWISVFVTIALIWLYTYKGGIKTVVWTDTLQTFCILLGAGITVYIIGDKLNMGIGEMISTVASSEYSETFFWDIAPANNFFKQFISGIFITIAIAFGTMSIQSIKAALVNPANNLKSE